VSGVRDYFGDVTGARVIGAHNKGVNTGDTADTRSFFVVQMLLATRRGPAVIELEYDNHALLSETVSRVYELDPGKAPGLTGAEQARLQKAFAARGGHPADAGRLSESAAPRRVGHVVVPKPAKPQIKKPVASPQLRCVQHAHGDVVKMQKCAAR
jgi:hypothetical protein